MIHAPLDWERFKATYGYTDEMLKESALDKDFLEDLRRLHIERMPALESAADTIARHLRSCGAVYSIRYRVKDADHLIEKILRKRRDNSDWHPDLNLENYQYYITDLIGVRALHLFKSEWTEIHDFITKTWKQREKPTGNVRAGDPSEITTEFKARKCRIREHKAGYRSVHYVMDAQIFDRLYIVEFQVRTIFEDGWSEIDHQLRYPYDTKDATLNQSSLLLNRLAGTADELAGFISKLRDTMKLQQRLLQEAQKEGLEADKARLAAQEKLEETIKKLGVSESEKKNLRNKINQLIDHPFMVEVERARKFKKKIEEAATNQGLTLGGYALQTGITASSLLAALANDNEDSLGFAQTTSQPQKTSTKTGQMRSSHKGKPSESQEDAS